MNGPVDSDGNRIHPSSVIIPQIFTEGRDQLFILRSMALVWTIFFSDTFSPNIIDQLRVVSYSEVLYCKCVLIESFDTPLRTYEVTYDGQKKETHVISYIEQDRYVFSDDEDE